MGTPTLIRAKSTAKWAHRHEQLCHSSHETVGKDYLIAIHARMGDKFMAHQEGKNIHEAATYFISEFQGVKKMVRNFLCYRKIRYS